MEQFEEEKKKEKKKQKDAAMPQYEFDTEKYNLDALKDDLQKGFVKNLTTTSIVYNQDRCLRVIGKDEFGPKTQIFIYPCLMDEDGNFKFLISRKKGFYKINFTKRAELINQKIEAVGVNYIYMLKILNTLLEHHQKHPLRQIKFSWKVYFMAFQMSFMWATTFMMCS